MKVFFLYPVKRKVELNKFSRQLWLGFKKTATGLPYQGRSRGQDSACQCGGQGLIPVRKIPPASERLRSLCSSPEPELCHKRSHRHERPRRGKRE